MDEAIPLIHRSRRSAKKQLENKAGTFDEISYAVGYGNSSHFRELFKKHTGLLPTEYLKKFRP
ncbi:MAG: helix-turn-helix domain-containing protein [Proteobacteria bacterium]|nr:helix-turn-helix domain-containing protein [Pseudomonadota bacterium]MBU4470716.1 helix-turn-helix domain-containing protein [Pseudomonadota bacterium]